MIASSAGSSPLSETAPDARAVTAADIRPAAQRDVRDDRSKAGARSMRVVHAHRTRTQHCPSTPAEVQAADGPRVVVVCVSEADPPACTTPPPGQAAPFPPGCDDSPMITVRVDRLRRVAGAAGLRSWCARIRAPDGHIGNDAHTSFRAVRRSRRRGDDAQAVLETALVIPILLFLVCNFIAVMVQVTVQQQLNSATALAAQSRFQAPENAVDPAGARCCGVHGVTLVTAGLPTGCRYAAETFYGTMTTYADLLHWQAATLCTSGGDSGNDDQFAAATGRLSRLTRTGRGVLRHRLDQARRSRRPRLRRSHARIRHPVSTWSRAAPPRRSTSRTRRWPGVCSGRQRCTRRPRRSRLRSDSDVFALAGLDALERRSSGPLLSLFAPSFAQADCRALSVALKFAATGRSPLQRGQTLIVFALGFALFLFSLVCLVADSAYLYVWSGRVQDAAQLSAQSGADSVDPRLSLQRDRRVPRGACAVQIVDISAQDRQGTLYAFQRSCIQSGDQSAQIPRGPTTPSVLKTADDAQVPEGTLCASDGCRVYAEVTRVVHLPIPLPGFPRPGHGARHGLRRTGCRHQRCDVDVHWHRMGPCTTATLERQDLAPPLSSARC